MSALDALWREDATEDDQLDALQQLVNTGDAWRLEGSVGRAAMDAICRDEVEPGTKGSREYVAARSCREVD